MTPPSSTATADAHAAGGPITLRDLVQLLASAAGLSVYLVLLGGIVYWGQLSSAGLPADSLLSTADPRELMAIGVRSLLRGPVVILVLLALSAALPHIAAAVRSDRKFPRRLLQVGIVLIAVVVGFMLLYLGVALALLGLGLGALLGEQLDAAPGPGVLPRMLLGVVAAAVVIWKIRRGRAAAAPRPTADLPAYVAPVRWAVAVRQWLALWVPLWLLTVVLLELLVSWYLLDAVALQAAALVVATLPFVYWTAALSVWLWTTTDRVTVETVQTGKGFCGSRSSQSCSRC